MKRLLITTAIVTSALAPIAARAGVTSSFCGPSSEGGPCEGAFEAKVWLQAAKDVTTGFGNIGAPAGLPIMTIKSDGGQFSTSMDLANGFATITADPGKVFNGITVSIGPDATHPYGYGFTDLVFDTQLANGGNNPETFNTTAFDANGNVAPPVGLGQNGHNQDAEYSITAVGGLFGSVDISAAAFDGFVEIKHLEVSGLCAFTSAARTDCDPVNTPEPASMLVLGTGLLSLGVLRRRR